MSYKKDIWENNHLDGKEGSYVTSVSFKNISNYHKIQRPVNKTILEIGIGKGATVNELKTDNKVIACDISQNALDKVDCYQKLLSTELERAEPVDLAISHLTLQHCNEEEVLRIIDTVKLKPGAFFTFQFASLDVKKSHLEELILNDLNNAMLYFYSPEKMKQIISHTNKKVIHEIGPIWFKSPFNFEWNIFRVENK